MPGDLLRIAMLYDFYGSLLTDRQREAMELYYHHDWSLAEIAAQIGSSRQAVSDALRRAEAGLEAIEAKLGFVGQYEKQREITNELLQLFNDIEAVVAVPTGGEDGIGSRARLKLRERINHARDLVRRLQ